MTKQDQKLSGVRALVLAGLLEVLEKGGLSSRVLHDILDYNRFMEKRDRAFLSRLFEGTIERKLELDYVIDRYSSITVRKMKPVIRNILRMAVYQILYMDQVPDSAACNQAVLLAAKKGFGSLKGFVNGVLRNISRDRDGIVYPDMETQPVPSLSVRYSLPEWLVSMWLSDYGIEMVKIMGEAALADRDTTLRCNCGRITPEDLILKLRKQGIHAELGAYLPYAVRVSGYDSVSRIPGFEEGYFQVQDESSMLAAEAAGVTEDSQVIDLCAAPGGKCAHLAQLLGGTGRVSARDISESKTALIEENMARQGLSNLDIMVQDATEIRPCDVGRADVVMADLPCSGLGIIGRKTDIKYKISPEAIEELAGLQRRILSTAQSYVKPGGILIYSTCTVSRRENTDNREWFLNEHPDFKPDSLTPFLPEILRGADSEQGYLQLIPGIHDTDGFYIARFRKEKNKGDFDE